MRTGRDNTRKALSTVPGTQQSSVNISCYYFHNYFIYQEPFNTLGRYRLIGRDLLGVPKKFSLMQGYLDWYP